MRLLLWLLLMTVPVATAKAEPWLDVFAVEGADSMRVEVGDLLEEDAALAVEEPESAEAPRGVLTVIDAAGRGSVYAMPWDPLAGRLSAQFPATEPPFLLGVTIHTGGILVFLPQTGLLEFPEED